MFKQDLEHLMQLAILSGLCFCLQFLVRNNFYVLIDDHSEDPTVQNDANLWVTYYTQLMTDITKDVPSRNRVMVDVLNEPDHAGLNWSQVWIGLLFSIWSWAVYECGHSWQELSSLAHHLHPAERPAKVCKFCHSPCCSMNWNEVFLLACTTTKTQQALHPDYL